MHEIQTFDIAQAKKVMVFSLVNENTIKLRCFTSNIPSPTDAITKETVEKPEEKKKEDDNLIEVGPSVTFNIRRVFAADEDLYREALKKPKVLVHEKKKVLFLLIRCRKRILSIMSLDKLWDVYTFSNKIYQPCH